MIPATPGDGITSCVNSAPSIPGADYCAVIRGKSIRRTASAIPEPWQVASARTLFYTSSRVAPLPVWSGDHARRSRMQSSETFHLLISCGAQPQLEACLSLFRDAGHNTRAHRVTSPRDLADMLRDQRWDLLIADDSHPELSPAEALKLLREQASDTPCIVRSAEPLTNGVLECLKLGARDVVAQSDSVRLLSASQARDQRVARTSGTDRAAQPLRGSCASRGAAARLVAGCHRLCGRWHAHPRQCDLREIVRLCGRGRTGLGSADRPDRRRQPAGIQGCVAPLSRPPRGADRDRFLRHARRWRHLRRQAHTDDSQLRGRAVHAGTGACHAGRQINRLRRQPSRPLRSPHRHRPQSYRAALSHPKRPRTEFLRWQKPSNRNRQRHPWC